MTNSIQAVEQKMVNFNGTELLGIKANDGKVYVGVRWVCEGIELSEGQVKAERKRIQEDIVLKKGGRNFVLPTIGGNQEVLTLDIDFLPLWLAKITITPNMKRNQPELTDRMVDYQLKAKDVLAQAFIHNLVQQPKLPTTYKEALLALVEQVEVAEKLEAYIEESKPKVEFADAIIKSDDNILVREMSKLIQQKGINIGEKKLYKFLRDWNYILRHKNEPTQYAMNQGLFVVDERVVRTEHGNKITTTPKVTPKGQIRIVKKIKKELALV